MSNYPANSNGENPGEMSFAEQDAAYEAHRGEIEDFVDSTLDNVPEFDFDAFMKALSVKLPEHIELRRKQKEGGDSLMAAMKPYNGLPYSSQVVLGFADLLLGNQDNRRAKFTSNPATLDMGAA